MIMNFPPDTCDECKRIKEFMDTVRCNYCNCVVCSDCIVEHEYREAESNYELYKGEEEFKHLVAESNHVNEMDDSWIAYNPTPEHKIH